MAILLSVVLGAGLARSIADRVRHGAPIVVDPPPPHRVRLSTATAGELASLPGVGPVLAARIVAARAATGLARLDDLRAVRGIGDGVLEGLAPYVEED